MVDYGRVLLDAEMAYKLALAVRRECDDESRSEPRFEYPERYMCKGRLIEGVKSALSARQERRASSALLHCATYTMVVQLNTVREKFQKKNGGPVSQEVRTAFEITRHIRNAYAHDPLRPMWLFGGKQRILELPDVMRLDTGRLHGKQMRLGELGGVSGILKLSGYVRHNLQ